MQHNALVVNDLTKKYPDFVLDKVSFSVPCGTIVGLIGENGAGKTEIPEVLSFSGRQIHSLVTASAIKSGSSLTETTIPTSFLLKS